MSIDVSKYSTLDQVRHGDNKKSTSFLNRDINFSVWKFSDKKKEQFYNQLSVLFDAGLDLKNVLELVHAEQTKKKDAKLLETILNNIIQGDSLSLALQREKQFSEYEYYSIKIGEETGRLNEVLKELTLFYARKIKQRRQMVSVFTYPVFVLLISFGVIYFMLSSIVPMFSDVFKRFGEDLPPLTQNILGLSNFISNNSKYIGLILIAIGILFYTQRKNKKFSSITSRIALKMPIWGEIIKRVQLARFCQSMNLLISSKTPLVKALELVEKMIGFYPISHSVSLIKKDILDGLLLHESLAKHSIYDKRFRSLVKVGEEVNQLDKIFQQIAHQYNQEVEHRTGLIGSIIEPVMIIVLGLIVGLILIAMYMPLFKLSNVVG